MDEDKGVKNVEASIEKKLFPKFKKYLNILIEMFPRIKGFLSNLGLSKDHLDEVEKYSFKTWKDIVEIKKFEDLKILYGNFNELVGKIVALHLDCDDLMRRTKDFSVIKSARKEMWEGL
jgi:hypothetical protein